MLGHQVTMWLELPVMSWVLSVPINIESGVHTTTKGSGVYKIRFEQALTAQVTWGSGPNAMSSTPATSLFLPQHISVAPWGVTSSISQLRKRTLGSTHGSIQNADNTWKCTAVAVQILAGTSLKDSVEMKSSQWAELWAVCLVVLFAWKEKWPELQIHTS